MKVWYARVSTTWQKLEIQIEKLKKAWCAKIFKEKVTGTSTTKCLKLKEALDYVRNWDVLYITKLDRLARSVCDLTKIVQMLDTKKTWFVVLDQDINTLTPTGRLLFHMISAIWEFERDLIIERTAEWKEDARHRWVKFWRKPKLWVKN